MKENGADLYGTKKVDLPRPELYVVYTGDNKNVPSEITLSNEFFDGNEAAIEVKIKVISETAGTDIINQYILFSKIYNEQRAAHGRTKEAILETIRICKDRNILKEYLESREKEVIDIMMALFDEQEIREMHEGALARENRIRGVVEGLQYTGMDRSGVAQVLVDRLHLTPQAAESSVSEFWQA